MLPAIRQTPKITKRPSCREKGRDGELAFLTVLDEFGAFPAVIQRELDRYLPFLAATKVLMAVVRMGVQYGSQRIRPR